MKLFSRRNEVPEDVYSYEIPDRVRNRLLLTLQKCVDSSRHTDMMAVLEDAREVLFRKYGQLYHGNNHWSITPSPAKTMIDHVFSCPDEEVMDFFQVVFSNRGFGGGQRTVDEINQVLEEENIGYEIGDFQKEEFPGQGQYGGTSVRIIPPIIIKKDEKTLHQEVVKPCLHVLSDQRFANARDELHKAFEEYRKGEYDDAITDAGSAFETVMKTICTLKKWPYDKDKDACSAMVDHCRANGLFPPFYKALLEAVGTIRNKVGDAHGKGPKKEVEATKELADHMLYMVCNNINLLITLADL